MCSPGCGSQNGVTHLHSALPSSTGLSSHPMSPLPVLLRMAAWKMLPMVACCPCVHQRQRKQKGFGNHPLSDRWFQRASSSHHAPGDMRLGGNRIYNQPVNDDVKWAIQGRLWGTKKDNVTHHEKQGSQESLQSQELYGQKHISKNSNLSSVSSSQILYIIFFPHGNNKMALRTM